jgi:hypothetical protein
VPSMNQGRLTELVIVAGLAVLSLASGAEAIIVDYSPVSSTASRRPASTRCFKIRPGPNRPARRPRSSSTVWAAATATPTNSCCASGFQLLNGGRGARPIVEQIRFNGNGTADVPGGRGALAVRSSRRLAIGAPEREVRLQFLIKPRDMSSSLQSSVDRLTLSPGERVIKMSPTMATICDPEPRRS